MKKSILHQRLPSILYLYGTTVCWWDHCGIVIRPGFVHTGFNQYQKCDEEELIGILSHILLDFLCQTVVELHYLATATIFIKQRIKLQMFSRKATDFQEEGDEPQKGCFNLLFGQNIWQKNP